VWLFRGVAGLPQPTPVPTHPDIPLGLAVLSHVGYRPAMSRQFAPTPPVRLHGKVFAVIEGNARVQ